MKKISLFCTGPLMYLTELPVLYLLFLCIKYNDGVTTPFKLYPLIIALIGLAVYMFIYLFRIITISTDIIKAVGPYSSKEKAIIKENKSLVFTILPRGKVKVELFGCDEEPPALDWAQNEEREKLETNLFRDRTVGGESAVRRVLKYFGVPSEDIAAVFKNESFDKNYDSFNVLSEIKNEIREVKISFTKTI